MATPIRVTELPQPLTCDIDMAQPEELIRTLASSDAQMFTGFMGLPCCYDSCHVDSMVDLINRMSSALQHPNGRIVFSGCGTSGRLSHLTARSFNAACKQAALSPKFDYLLGGGDAALLVPQEAAEDKPDTPVSDLHAWEATAGVKPTDPVVVVGISCGLSATYVGALLEAILAPGSRPGYTAVCVGFNPVDSVRHVKVDTWQSSTFHTVLTQMQAETESGRAIILNPITGPESIAGSSRMKGGSMTKILLETACACALKHATLARTGGNGPTREQVADWVRDCYLNYERTIRVLYAESVPSIARLMAEAGRTLNTPVDGATQLSRASGHADAGFSSPTGRGRVVYLGVGVAAAIALIDASECTPTYGSLFNDVRGFVAGGWPALRIHEGDLKDIAVLPHVRGDAHLPQSAARAEIVSIDLPAFHRDVLPYLGPADLVLAVAVHEDQDGQEATAQQHRRGQEEVLQGLKAACAKGCKTSYVTVQSASAGADSWQLLAHGCSTIPGVTVSLPAASIRPGQTTLLRGQASAAGESTTPVADNPRAYSELALKLCLNAITTGAHVARGTIYGNRMVNVMCTNQKLFHRAVGIIADVSKTDRKLAEISLVRAVYGYDADAEEMRACMADWRVRHAGTIVVSRGNGAGAGGAAQGRLAHLLATSTGEHVAAASSQLGLVPVSILLSANSGRTLAGSPVPLLTVADAKAVLKQEPVIRKALAQCLSG